MPITTRQAKRTLTYSAISKFLDCAEQYRKRYVQQIVPREWDIEALFFGSAWHKIMARHNIGEDASPIIERVELLPQQKSGINRIKLRAMYAGYKKRFPDDKSFKTEVPFRVPLINPDTGRASRLYEFAGVVDGEINEPLILVEHKTVGQISESLLEGLSVDLQILLYSYAISRVRGKPVEAVIYNIVAKSLLRPKKNENMYAYSNRLHSQYEDPQMFYREKIEIQKQDIDRAMRNLWIVTHRIRDAELTDCWSMNNHVCNNNYGHACAYLPLCQHHDDELLLANQYKHETPHGELIGEA